MKRLPENSVERKLMQARVRLILSQPFFGSLSLRLKLVPGSNKTMATDGRHIFYNPVFVEALRPEELEGVLAHEVMHVALGHHCRRGERDPKIWNDAADYAINPIILKNGFALPEGVLVNPAYDNLCAEDIYARLLRTPQPDSSPQPKQHQQKAGQEGGDGSQQQPTTSSVPTGGGAGKADPSQPAPQGSQPDAAGGGDAPADAGAEVSPGGFGEVLDATDEDGQTASPAERERQKQEWSIAAEQAMRTAQSCGHEPMGVERAVKENRESAQDWRAILRAFVAATARCDYQWTPPNRRYVASGLYLPSVAKDGLGQIVIAVDTSGSIGQRELEQFEGEISAISNEAKPEAIYVVYCDAAVQSVQEFAPSDEIKLEPKGGGGTDFRPVFEWVEEEGIDPACLIYLTDLCCYDYPEVPYYPVLWACNSRRTAPFGETIQIRD